MPTELVLFGVVMLFIAAVGVPAIRRGIFLPRELDIVTVSDAALTERQRAYFNGLDVAMAALGYAPLLNFEVPNLQGANLTRVYRSDYDPAVLGASCLKAHSALEGASPSGHNYVEWITKYEDGTTLTTRNTMVSDVFDLMPHQVRQDCPGVGDVARLKALHDRRAEVLRVRQPRFPHGRDILGEFRDYHRRWSGFQESRGLLRYDAGAEVYRATAKAAWRGVANFLNPMADNFTPARFLVGLLLGAGIPAVATLLAQDPSLLERASRITGLSHEACRHGLLGGAYTAAGATVGWLFTSKSFVWALLLGYLPLRLAGGAAGIELLLAAWMGYVADRVSAFRLRRELLV